MIVALIVMALGVGLMFFAFTEPICWTGEGPFLFWPGLVLVVGSALWMGFT